MDKNDATIPLPRIEANESTTEYARRCFMAGYNAGYKDGEEAEFDGVKEFYKAVKAVTGKETERVGQGRKYPRMKP